MRQRKPFYNLEARILAGGVECSWRMAGKPLFREGRFAGYVGTAANITTEFRAKETMTYLAYNDGLTGLSNRAHFQKQLAECVARLDRYGSAFTLLYLDLDKFKPVNDRLGHQAGDRLLIEVGKRLGALVRKSDLVARLGGDEFALLLTQESDPNNIATCRRGYRTICLPFRSTEKRFRSGSASALRSRCSTDAGRPDRAQRRSALYRAKADGGGGYCFFETRTDAGCTSGAVRDRVVVALERDEFRSTTSRWSRPPTARVGLEALIRWNHPTYGLLPPVEFIPLAERTGLVARIGEWKIFEACRALARLPEHLTLAVNVSTKHFRSADIAAVVEQALKTANVAPHRLELEVTESLLMEDLEDAAGRLAELKKLGATICLDHFGAGYSSLTCLRKFSFDKIKIGSLTPARATRRRRADCTRNRGVGRSTEDHCCLRRCQRSNRPNF